MTVRAKFVVEEITEHKYGNQRMKTVKLRPVFKSADPDGENTKFWEASPNGEIRLGTINMAAAAQFEIGGEYYVTFDRADGPR